jgi:hypothetical protein
MIFVNAPAFVNPFMHPTVSQADSSDYVPMDVDEEKVICSEISRFAREPIVRQTVFPQPPKIFSQPIPVSSLRRSHAASPLFSSAVKSRFTAPAAVVVAAPRENRIVLMQKSQVPVLPEGCCALPHINSLTSRELSCVKNFTIIHKTFGSICFTGVTDIRDLNFANIISFQHMLIDYHPIDRLGPAVVILNNCFPKTIDVAKLPKFSTGEIDLEGLDENQHDTLERFADKLKRTCAKNNTEHCSWNPSTGEWKISITE